MVERSEQPRNIPFEEVAVKKLVLNQEVAKALGITFRPTSRKPLLGKEIQKMFAVRQHLRAAHATATTAEQRAP